MKVHMIGIDQSDHSEYLLQSTKAVAYSFLPRFERNLPLLMSEIFNSQANLTAKIASKCE